MEIYDPRRTEHCTEVSTWIIDLLPFNRICAGQADIKPEEGGTIKMKANTTIAWIQIMNFWCWKNKKMGLCNEYSKERGIYVKTCQKHLKRLHFEMLEHLVGLWLAGIVACFRVINSHLCRHRLPFLQVSNFCIDLPFPGPGRSSGFSAHLLPFIALDCIVVTCISEVFQFTIAIRVETVQREVSKRDMISCKVRINLDGTVARQSAQNNTALVAHDVQTLSGSWTLHRRYRLSPHSRASCSRSGGCCINTE